MQKSNPNLDCQEAKRVGLVQPLGISFQFVEIPCPLSLPWVENNFNQEALVSAMPSQFLSSTLNSIPLSSQQKTDEHWSTFEEILENLHANGIYIHSEQLAEFLLRHGLPVHLRYVPPHLRLKATQINENYQGDMVCLIEELEPPCWDYSWMDHVARPQLKTNRVIKFLSE